MFVLLFLCQDESPLAKRPPRPGLGLAYNELSASVPALLVATWAHRKQLTGGREAVGLWGGSFLHKTNGAQSKLKWKAPCPRRQDMGMNSREATSMQEGLSGELLAWCWRLLLPPDPPGPHHPLL